MCGRFTLATPGSELQRRFGLPEPPELRPRYNIAPTQSIAIVRRHDSGRELALVRWGLVPSWADDPGIGSRMINARAETVAEKPAFRAAFRKRRCLVPADGFYEWQARDGRKQPFLIRRRDHAPFAFAGLWEHWEGPKGRPDQRAEPSLQTATLITTRANAVLEPLHERMPVILDPADYDLWLDPAAPWQMAETLLRPCRDDALESEPVSTRVNSVRHDDPACVAPVTDEPPGLL